MAWRTRQQVKILCYHSITRRSEAISDEFKLHLPESLLRVHLAHLQKRYQVIGLDEYVAARQAGRDLPKNSVVLTFDDGFRNFSTAAAVNLREFNFPATVFIITGKTTDSAAAQNWQPSDDYAHS